MGLYDRDYALEKEVEFSRSEGRIAVFIKDTYKLILASLIAAVGGAYLGMGSGIAYSPLLFLVVEFALLFGLFFADKSGKRNLALGLLFVFTFITGFFLGPVLNAYVGRGMGYVVTQAFVGTAVTFGALTLYAFNAKADFSSWGKPLFFILIGVMVASILNYFFFKSTMMSLVVSGLSAILFSAYILYDTQNIIKGRYDSPIMAAVGMYLNILNLFISLLNILGITNRD
ncbi:Bax inhibitor-1/YccA family protein [Campylobacter sp. FMV-PI01]|uniref:Bax inhibitor-1/YccA family protein n=1 Tax=Campylobacter portucalensis TaxID=2608384 RepID=A0A6L5WIZ6_9BACT|nr:Bax inhibitor-1/YccA family protein [Campylobacter portucalensis]MSN96227.1 Bax inhibitor-1/YccA family protein [Campylobacter portucalensis]